MPTVPVLTPAQASEWDQAAVKMGRPLRMLMENAGRSVVSAARATFPRELAGGTLVACGTGNNGGDGWVVARTLHAMGAPVWVTEVAAPRSEPAVQARSDALTDGVPTVPPDGPWPSPQLVVDAVLGSGAVGAPRTEVASLLERLRSLEVPVLAIDGPSGLDLSTGADHGCIPADLSVTFGGVRKGHFLARDDVGTIVVAEIGHPVPASGLPIHINSRWAAQRIEPFPARAHKGQRGRVVVVGGSPGMSGAVRFTARGAFAAGAGLVHAVVPPQLVSDLTTAEPDVQVSSHETSGALSAELVALLEQSDAVVLGPGLGRAPGVEQFVAAVLERSSKIVIDADALHALARSKESLAAAFEGRSVVLTPHPGEFRTLFPDHSGQLETDPWGALADALGELPVTIALKGAPSIVGSPGDCQLTVGNGNPGLATGGSGDVLAGVIGALLGAGLPSREASAVAAHALGEAADVTASRLGVRAIRPQEVVTELGGVWRRWAAGGFEELHGELARIVRPMVR